MILFSHQPVVSGFGLAREEPMSVGEIVTIRFRGHERRMRCTSVWTEDMDGPREDVAKLIPDSPWRRVRGKR
jgi:hypothetical protein